MTLTASDYIVPLFKVYVSAMIVTVMYWQVIQEHTHTTWQLSQARFYFYLQYCAKVMQAKCPNFVLCSRELSTKVHAKVRAKIRGVSSDNSLEQRAIFR